MIRDKFSKSYYEKLDGQLSFDYVDLNFTHNQIQKAYIVGSLPKHTESANFWKAIWDENVEHTVLIDNIYDKEEPKIYWNEKIDDPLHLDDISVQLIFKEIFGNYEYRKFYLIGKGQVKYIDQLRFTLWFDNEETIDYLLFIPFIQKLTKIDLDTTSPIFIYSRNSIKRTGFVLFCDMCLRMARKDGAVDALRIFKQLTETTITIESSEQYITAHLLVLDLLLNSDTSIKTYCLVDIEQEKVMTYLENTKWLDLIMQHLKKTKSQYYEFRRNSSSLLELTGKSLLKCLSEKDLEASEKEMIKTVKVDGYKAPAKFIVTSTPSPDALITFWKLIIQKNISVVIVLSEINPTQKMQSSLLWPNQENPILIKSKSLKMEYKNIKKRRFYDLITVELSLTGQTEHSTVDLISIKNWSAKSKLPPMSEFVTFCKETVKLLDQSNPIMLTCCDGFKMCGLYIAMIYMIERFKYENVCDVAFSVRNVRKHSIHFFEDKTQLEFLYKTAMEFLKEQRLCEYSKI